MHAKIYTGLFLCLSVVGCGKEEAVIQPESFYDQSHRNFLQLKGGVTGYHEYKKADESDPQKQFVASVSFDRNGNLTEYSPIEEDPISAYWLPIARERFVYEYDDRGRLAQVRVFETPENSFSYKLKYGSHSDYILLPFELKPVGEWLVKGLVSIESDNSGFIFTYENGEAFLTKEEAGSRQTTICNYERGYPAKQTVRHYAGEEIYRTETTSYQFDMTTGCLLSKNTVIDDVDYPETEESWIYNKAGQCVKQTNDISGSTTVNTYTYNTHNWLTGILVKGDVKNGEHQRSYGGLDNNGNWTECYLTTTGFVSWEYPEGEEMLIREYTY